MTGNEFKKVLGDLRVNRRRSVLVIAAICLGLIGAGTVIDAYSILSRELVKNYLVTAPASATIHVDTADPAIVDLIENVPELESVELRRKIVGRIRKKGGEWQTAWFFVLPDFNAQKIDMFFPQKGSWPPQRGELLLERNSLSIFPVEFGDELLAKLPSAAEVGLRLGGSSYAPGLAPSFMEGVVYCHLTSETAALLGAPKGYNEIKLRLNGDAYDKKRTRRVAYTVADILRGKGIAVVAVVIPEPGQHPHYTQMMTLLYLLGAFGFLGFCLSAVLAANMVSSIMSRQTKEIGIMKAVGGSRARIGAIYFTMIAVLALIALAVALPAAALLGIAFSKFSATVLNFKIFDSGIPLWSWASIVALGLFTPLAVAILPILRGTALPVRQAFSDYGLGQRGGKVGLWGSLALRTGWLPRPLLISLRNSFRRRNRMLLTVGTLSLGGAVFITAMNVNASLGASVIARYNASNYDIQLFLSRPVAAQGALEALKELPGVERVEAWGGTSAWLLGEDGREISDKDFSIMAPPSDSRMLAEPKLEAGRWLKEGDQACLVINQRLALDWPGTRVGDRVRLRLEGKDGYWTIVGILQEFIVEPGAYASADYLMPYLGREGAAARFLLSAKGRVGVDSLGEAAEATLAARGIDVARTEYLGEFLQNLRDHFVILVLALSLMTVMVVCVGGMGMASSMGVNVLERTREIGVMRAIGAGRGSILGMVVAEGAIVGAISWAFAVLLSWPVSSFLTQRFGMIFFESPLSFAVSRQGLWLWLGLSAVIAAVASILPALRAGKMSVREALSYE